MLYDPEMGRGGRLTQALRMDDPFADLIPGEQFYTPTAFGGAETSTTPIMSQLASYMQISQPQSQAWDAASYLAANPDVQADWQNQAYRFYSNPADYARYHYDTYGRNENRTWGSTAPVVSNPTPVVETPATSTPAIGGATPAPAPMSLNDFIASTPGYQFQLNKGLDAINSNAYARGIGNSGATFKGLTDYGQNLASNYYQQYLSNVQGVANAGLGAAGSLSGAGNNMAAGVSGAMNNAAQAYQNSANATANAAYQRANATAGLATGIANGIGQFAGTAFGSSYRGY